MGTRLLQRVMAGVTPGRSLVALIVCTMGFVAVIAPADHLMGPAQRIVYVHVAVAWFALVAIILTAFTAIVAAWRRSSEWDAWSRAAAEVGWLSCSLTLITGSLWAQQAWGTWWTWDARLTTAFALWLVYAVMLIIRWCGMNDTWQMRCRAGLGIAGIVDLPLVVMATRWFRGMHPVAPDMEPSMRLVLLVTVCSFAIFFGYLLVTRQRQLRTRQSAATSECGATSSQAFSAELSVCSTVRSVEWRARGWPDEQLQHAGNTTRRGTRAAAGSVR